MFTLTYTLSHLFIPSSSNNHKSKILHSSTILIITFFLVLYQVLLRTIPLTGARILGYAANIPPAEVIRLTNEKRAENGVSPVVYSEALERAAKMKGEHMLANSYWAHTAPDGTEPWKFFNDVGYKYRYAGENLARDFSNPSSAVDAWMASPSHRDNLLSPKYQEIGIAVVEGPMNGVETTIIVQLFGTRYGESLPKLPVASVNSSASPPPKVVISPTLIPTLSEATPTQVPTPNLGFVASNNPSGGEKSGGANVLLSPFNSTKNLSLTILSVMLLVLVIDGIIVERRKITRLAGRTFAHFIFLGIILFIVMIIESGKIL